MSLSEEPFEEPPRKGKPADDTGFMPEDSTVDLGPPPEEVERAQEALAPGDHAEATATLLTQLANYQREEFERVTASMYDNLTQMLDGRLEGLHDPHAVFVRGVIFGIGMIVLGLLILLALGWLFLSALRSLGA